MSIAIIPKARAENWLHRAIYFAVFLICGLTLFLLQFLAFNSKSRELQITILVGLPVVFCSVTAGPRTAVSAAVAAQERWAKQKRI
jgi:hypothetical protein